ncbi:MAG: serine/threonine-protein phosphatase [Kiritimatiellae bacterium]|nr:serine/threonine-protein phosphatase [Kiritimatiellia bacterium]
MLDELLRKFRFATIALLVGPPLVFLLIFAVLLLRSRVSAHEAEFEVRAASRVGQLSRIVQLESARLAAVSRMPSIAAVALASQRRDVQVLSEKNLEERWAQSSREDMMVRGVVDNDVSAQFRDLQAADPALLDMRLTDTQGYLLASPAKPDRYIQRDAPWWRAGRDALPGTVAAPGISTDGTVDFAAAVIRVGRQSVVDGVLYSRVDLAARVRDAQIKLPDGEVLFVLGGVAPWVVASAERGNDRAAAFVDKLHLRAEASGHEMGYRYLAVPLDAGVAWTNPVRAVVAVSEAAIPLSVLYLPGLIFLLAVAGLAGLALLVAPLAGKFFFEPLRETTDAGTWVLRTAFARGGVGGRSTPIQKELASWYTKMQQELQAQSSALAADVTRDLELATEFQQAFLSRPLPEIPEVHLQGRLRLEFYHRYQPAMAMGGDFFDVTPLATDTAGIFIGDVMGHGTRSALIVAILRTLIDDQSRRGRNAPHFLRELNNEFCNMLKVLPQPFFASAAYFVADTTSRVATYSVAGHPPPFHLHRALGRVARLDMPKPQGAALGLVPNEEFGGSTVRLNDGDSFIFFTDGVYEAANAQGEEFGFARFEKVLRANVYRSSRDILDAVMDAITVFSGSQALADDVCLFAVDVTTTAR